MGQLENITYEKIAACRAEILKDKSLSKYLKQFDAFCDYLKRVEGQKMQYNGLNPDLTRFKFVSDYQTRYSLNYVNSVYARFKALEKSVKDSDKELYLSLLTLTTYQRGRSIPDCLELLQESKRYLFGVLRNIRKKIGFLEYIWVVEPHKSGYPHAHVIIFTESDFMKYSDYLKNKWAAFGAGSRAHGLHLGSDESQKDDCFKVEYLAQYLLKYLLKSLSTVNASYAVFQSCVWAYRKPRKYPCYAKVELNKAGSYEVLFDSRGAFRLWGASAWVVQNMRGEYNNESESYMNYGSVYLLTSSDNKSALYCSSNLDIVRDYTKRAVSKINYSEE